MSVLASTTVRNLTPILAEQVVNDLYDSQGERWSKFGEAGRAKSVRDVADHINYLAAALASDEPNLFHEYLAWCKVLFAGLNFSPDALPDTLAAIRHVLEQSLPAEMHAEVLGLLDSGVQELQNAATVLPSFLVGNGPLDQLARNFLDALLAGNRHHASEMILAAVQGGIGVKDIYGQVFERTQREIGCLWQTNQIGVAQEHFCTAATQTIMSQLYPYIFTGQRKGRRMVMTCVGGELHEMGARMVADIFEMEGWDTYFLGANTPPEAVLRAVEERRADILAISITIATHLGQATALIDGLRQREGTKHTRVLVGGYPFNLSPNLWKKTGADGYAPNAQSALRTAEEVLQG